ncbi:phosphonate degradation HD-domain oxygenase [Myxosarcina sp. GI1]|uniref:phosphonate degradation HD-domain oxygenase n=1 Tax=Myxosarcina sp. GI1 TaxID=1541065 RepID=UPI0005682F5A|nr:phosphonate degradation HD-domain oxygenase [Myxosarcina sp. GI1]
MNYDLTEIIEILSTKGHEQYGTEAVSQLEHALQCATLAEKDNSSAELITSSLLHDFGHLVHNLGEDAATRGIDDRHEYRALSYLEKIFSPAVTEPIRMHVAAKRYLCATDFNYWASLSPASKTSLKLQGGIFSPEAAIKFRQQSFAEDAIKLRVWDDLAKVKNLTTPDLKHFMAIVETCC